MSSDANANSIKGVQANGSDVTQITVNGTTVWEDAYFEVSNLSAPSTVEEGTSFNVTADITNTGDGSDSQSISFNRGGSTSQQLDGGQATTVSFSETISSTGDYTVTISSADDSASSTVTVETNLPNKVTWNFDGSTKTYDLSDVDGTGYVEVYGAGGMDGYNDDSYTSSSPGPGGEGGYGRFEVDFSQYYQVEAVLSQSGQNVNRTDGSEPSDALNGSNTSDNSAASGALGDLEFQDSAGNRLALISYQGGGGGGSAYISIGKDAGSYGGSGGADSGVAGTGQDAGGYGEGGKNGIYSTVGGNGGDGAENDTTADGGTDGSAYLESDSGGGITVIDGGSTGQMGGGGQGNSTVILFADQ